MTPCRQCPVQAGADSKGAPKLAGTAGAPPDPYQKTKSQIWLLAFLHTTVISEKSYIVNKYQLPQTLREEDNGDD